MTAGVLAPRSLAARRDGPAPGRLLRGIKLTHALASVYLTAAVVVMSGAVSFRSRYAYALGGVAVLAMVVARRDDLRHVRVVLPAALYAALAVASLGWSVQPSFTMHDLRVNVVLVVITMLVAGLVPLDQLIRAHLRAIALVCVITVYYLATSSSTRLLDPGHPELGSAWRGGFIHKNELAMWAVFALPSVLAFCHSRWRRRWIVVLVILIVGSRSATGLSGLALTAVTWWWVGAMQRRESRTRGSLLMRTVALLGVAGFVAWLSVAPVASAFGKNLTLTGRTRIWAALVPKVLHKPLFGWGPGAFYGGFVNRFNADVIREVGFFHPHSHSAYFEVLLALGAVGGALVFALVVSVVDGGVRLFDRAPNIARWVLACMLPLCVMSVSEPTFPLAGWFSAVIILRLVELRVRDALRRGGRDTLDVRWTHGRNGAPPLTPAGRGAPGRTAS